MIQLGYTNSRAARSEFRYSGALKGHVCFMSSLWIHIYTSSVKKIFVKKKSIKLNNLALTCFSEFLCGFYRMFCLFSTNTLGRRWVQENPKSPETTEHLSFDSNKDLLLLIPWRRCCFLQTKPAKKKTRNAKFAGGDYAVHSSTRNENICRCFLYKHFVPFK